MTGSTVTLLKFYRFEGFIAKYVAISAMGLSKIWFPKKKAMGVNKLLGTGSGLGFSRKANLGQYVHFGIWDSLKDYEEYSKSSFLLNWLNRYSTTSYVLQLEPYQSKGKWDGINPYPNIPANHEEEGNVVILTRAKVKLKNLFDFWKHVHPTNERLKLSKGRMFSAGLGEWPFSHPITFSIWENLDRAKDFACSQIGHGAAATAARKGNWFKEDLFVRYRIVAGEVPEQVF